MNKFLCIFLCFLIACVPPSKQELTIVDVDLNKPEVKSAIDYQVSDSMDSLMALLSHEDPTIRFLATQANASLKTKMPIDSLVHKLDDKIMEVRASAAYALGQYNNTAVVPGLLSAFKNEDTLSVNTMLNHNILEAIGKSGDEKMLELISSTNSYRESDTLLLLGQARGIYRFALRGMYHPNGTSKMVQHVTNPSIDASIRLAAANYLSRSKELDIENFKFQIADAARQEPIADIRMALLYALRHTDDLEVMKFLLAHLDREKDYRAKINTVKALYHHPYNQVVDKFISLCSDDNIHVASVAADYLVSNGSRQDASYYRELARDSMHWLIKSKLYKSVFTNLPLYYVNTRSSLKREILSVIESSNDRFEKIAYITVLGEDLNAYDDILDLLKSESDPVLKSTAAESLAKIYSNKDFPLNIGRAGPYARAKLRQELTEVLAINDVGVLYHIANSISNTDLRLNSIVNDVQGLLSAKDKLSLPKDVETYNALINAINICKPDTALQVYVPDAKSQIDWNFLQEYPDTTIAIIKTNKGIIKVDLYYEQAPQSVYNFVSLAAQDFYDDKVFHRVVPNFVIQGGCPRGDGFGSSPTTIRSEFSQLYYNEGGYIGMASAGAHTESTQWFITHSPTPHLDGRYTIFGKVTEGMDVVHQILPGDQIQDIILTSVL